MSFAMRASTNSLETPDNLARWGKVKDASCKMCLAPGQPNTKILGTLGHILNNCPRILERYEWRHNGVLAFIYDCLTKNKPEEITMYSDFEGAKVNGGTIPPHIMVTTSRPDLVIIDNNTLHSAVG